MNRFNITHKTDKEKTLILPTQKKNDEEKNTV